jgi:hypothetical protein
MSINRVLVVFSTNKTDSHDITEILLKVALNTITITLTCKQVKHGGHLAIFYTILRHRDITYK